MCCLPSVCPSVTRVDQLKTVEVRIMQLLPQNSPITLVSTWLTSPRNFTGNIEAGAPNERGVWKIRNFQPIGRRGSSGRGRQMTVRLSTSRRRQFLAIWAATSSETLEIRLAITWRYAIPCRPVIVVTNWLQNEWPRMTLSDYFMSKSVIGLKLEINQAVSGRHLIIIWPSNGFTVRFYLIRNLRSLRQSFLKSCLKSISQSVLLVFTSDKIQDSGHGRCRRFELLELKILNSPSVKQNMTVSK